MQLPIMAEGADAAARQLDPFKNDRLGGAISFPDSKQRLLTQYRSARDALDASLALLGWAIDLRERLTFGLDLEVMQAEVRDFNLACEAHRALRRRGLAS
jgi:hypothetical protein